MKECITIFCDSQIKTLIIIIIINAIKLIMEGLWARKVLKNRAAKSCNFGLTLGLCTCEMIYYTIDDNGDVNCSLYQELLYKSRYKINRKKLS